MEPFYYSASSYRLTWNRLVDYCHENKLGWSDMFTATEMHGDEEGKSSLQSVQQFMNELNRKIITIAAECSRRL